MEILADIFIALFALSLVLLLAYALLRYISNIRSAENGSKAIKIISVCAIGQRERIVALQYHNKEYLVAVGPAGTTVIEKFTSTSTSDKE